MIEKNYYIREAKISEMAIVKSLFLEYAAGLGVDLCFQGFEKELETLPFPYNSPSGIILLAFWDDLPIGVVALKKWENACCEMKRLYVVPEYRNEKIGEKLTLTLLNLAKEMGYTSMKLDTLERLVPAVKLYRRLGFKEIPPYNVNPEADILYFEKQLVD
mgnify:CR=1 FL=1|jgi:ribosomal protein S18 acetylase RimI-like enzyme